MSNFKNRLNFNDKTLNIVGKRKIWFMIPIIILVIASIIFSVFAIINNSFQDGMNVGLDFTGGTIMTVPVGTDLVDNYDEYVERINTVFEANDLTIGNTQISENSVVVRYKNILDTDEAMSELNDKVKVALEAEFSEIYTHGFTSAGDFIEMEFIGSTVSSELISTALLAIFITLILILCYVIIRFEWISAIAAVIALLHDALMIVALTIIFRVQINSSFVIAIVTIIAYSINNMIVIFDRVREELKIATAQKINNKKLDIEFIVNNSVTMTLNRTINTSMTTVFTVLMLVILSVQTLREFALPLLFGLLSGGFSATCIAPSLFVIIKKKMMKRNAPQVKAPVATAKPQKVIK